MIFFVFIGNPILSVFKIIFSIAQPMTNCKWISPFYEDLQKIEQDLS